MSNAVPSMRAGWAGGLALALVALAAGCGGGDRTGRPDAVQSTLNEMMGRRLGEAVAEATEPGEVVLVHVSRTPDEPGQWVKGLQQGLGGGYSVTVLGPQELPQEAMSTMGGFPALAHALQQYPSAAAVITAMPIGAYERPTFPAQHPPVFALSWSYLPDAAFLLEGKKLTAGVFDRLGRDVLRDMDASLSPDELFDRNCVVATPDNYRSVAAPYEGG